MKQPLDCVVCGSCVADILVRPVPLEHPIGGGTLFAAEPVRLHTGGIVCNAGITLARLGMRTAAFTCVGEDLWGDFIRSRLQAEGVDTACVAAQPGAPTSTTAVLVDSSGERTFAHCVGAHGRMDRGWYLSHLDLFARCRMMLLGYYSLMPSLGDDLVEVLAAIRETGCRTAMDAAGSGGDLEPLRRALPHLDVWCPSYREARHQTGLDEPREILDAYRDCGAPGLLGIKLGADGALLSPAPGQYVRVVAIAAPGPVVDTTGAGDCFFGGLLCGLLRGLDAPQSGRLAAAAGACCVSALGATAGILDYRATAELAGL